MIVNLLNLTLRKKCSISFDNTIIVLDLSFESQTWYLYNNMLTKGIWNLTGLTLNTPGDLAISLGTSDTVRSLIHSKCLSL